MIFCGLEITIRAPWEHSLTESHTWVTSESLKPLFTVLNFFPTPWILTCFYSHAICPCYPASEWVTWKIYEMP
jgi:hypothetical protein